MSIIESIKSLIGYNYNDLDMVFAILSIFVIFFFFMTMFNILMYMFKR